MAALRLYHCRRSDRDRDYEFDGRIIGFTGHDAKFSISSHAALLDLRSYSLLLLIIFIGVGAQSI